MTTINMRRGTSREIIVPVTDQDGNPLDLSGDSTARFWVGNSVYSTGADVWLRKDTSSGITISDDGNTPPLFSLNIAIEPADSETVEPRLSYYYEAEVTTASGEVYVVAGDTFELVEALTT